MTQRRVSRIVDLVADDFCKVPRCLRGFAECLFWLFGTSDEITVASRRAQLSHSRLRISERSHPAAVNRLASDHHRLSSRLVVSSSSVNHLPSCNVIVSLAGSFLMVDQRIGYFTILNHQSCCKAASEAMRRLEPLDQRALTA